MVRELEDVILDLLPLDGFEPSVSGVQNPSQETVDPRRYCQVVVAAVIMGDSNAEYAVEAAHRRQLLSVGSLQTRTMLILGCAFSRSATIGDNLYRRLGHSSNGSFFPSALEG